MQTQAIIFDLDGTLVDSQRDIMQSVLVALADSGIDGHSLENLIQYQGYPLSEIYHSLAPNPTQRGRQRFVHLYRAHYCDHCIDSTRPFPGLVAVLEQLRGLPMAVATAKPTYSAYHLLDRLGLSGFFSYVVGSERFAPKPDPQIVLHCLTQLGVQAGHTLMVGDTDRDIIAAKRAGCRSVAVSWGGFDRKKLLALQPDALIDRAEQLLELIGGQ